MHVHSRTHTYSLITQPRVNVDGTVSVEDAETSDLIWHGYPDGDAPTHQTSAAASPQDAPTREAHSDVEPNSSKVHGSPQPPDFNQDTEAHQRQEDQAASSPKDSESEEPEQAGAADVRAPRRLP
jgi:hypothetical protein